MLAEMITNFRFYFVGWRDWLRSCVNQIWKFKSFYINWSQGYFHFIKSWFLDFFLRKFRVHEKLKVKMKRGFCFIIVFMTCPFLEREFKSQEYLDSKTLSITGKWKSDSAAKHFSPNPRISFTCFLFFKDYN